ncbi:fasciclin-like arabinogalactan protein 19 [Herrania umbratica]|uniref:Fasciclin-like arabinogalactan protein 19 n=1 Tax=Herrania umbratica TaxID=108875 RepID=A0A6J1BMF0_9ROSI|nr:fasciclin-like arabinogalactan protein 19 [Herrania umbratica]
MEIFSSEPTTLLLLLLLLLTAPCTTADLTSQELDAALFALRSNGYTLFPNAITTSDLQPRLLSSQNSSFTLFSPPDSLLFSLDLLSSARLYTFSLLFHVSPHLLFTSDLLSLRRPYIETLLPNRHLFVEKTQVPHNGSVLPSVAVDGVRVSVPDLFLGSNIAVHGLDGILVPRYRARDNDGAFSELGPVMAPKSRCQTCISPVNPPESLPPMGSGVPEMVTVGTGLKKDGRSDPDNDRGTNKGSRHSTFFQFKNLFTR